MVFREPARRRPRSVALTRTNILARDRHRCQYCGSSPPIRELTIDHVLPRSRGGRTTWDNVATACGPCNRRKGNRTPNEAGMPLIGPPVQPPYMVFERRGMFAGDPPQQWRDYLPL